MKRAWMICLALALASASCGSRATNCTDYAAELDERLAATDNAQEVLDWIDDTSDDVARLIQKSEGDGRVCVEAILEAMFTAGFKELEAELDSLLSE
jgi:hypothetical protein